MAKIAYEDPEDPDGRAEVNVDADQISESGKVHGVRLRLDDGRYLHIPSARVYWIEMREEEGKVDYSSP
ncbi:hypothetical protein [Halopelagius longus]|uniref:Uncharacterized protein n=1 Tax=Halopelagius longus TaxID=1236180 RepID=A0A1H0YP80_9EURY|nr:hypothetical protein [Halopelagius longus]RDI72601.1 hypothetical protein DWB78_13210 [Halopelagius longus]SDQ16955.1 hypothetical protein SAMN05216278_0758 [Halopelagius longus]